VLVIKKSGDKEKFDPEKIKRGVRTSCKNRPITSAQIDDLVNEVAKRVYFSGQEEITSEEVGHLVQEELRKIDPVAYLRFTSVYQAFVDLEQFEQVIQNSTTPNP
jgi:transcriptional repressor NrdR